MTRAGTRTKKPVRVPKVDHPTEILAPYLGKRPDTYFSEKIGCSVNTVAAFRAKHKLPSYGERCRERLPITIPDAEVDRAIAAYRIARRKYRPKTGRPPKVKTEA